MEAIEKEGIIQIITEHNFIKIIDNGCGIDSSTSDKLFTPFFSTKTHGQGVGLTLVREILLNHQVGFSLETKNDGWTIFKMEFTH